MKSVSLQASSITVAARAYGAAIRAIISPKTVCTEDDQNTLHGKFNILI